MWMTDYVRAVKRSLRDEHAMQVIGGTQDDPNVDCPDGEYHCTIEDGRVDVVIVKGGKFKFDIGNPKVAK